MDHVTRATSLSGMISHPQANTWYNLQAVAKHAKFDDASFTRSRDISGGVKFLNAPLGPDHGHLGAVGHPKVSISHGQTVHKIWSL